MYIVFENEDKSIGVIIPSAEYADNIESLAEKDVPSGLQWQIVKDLPSREFRGAWELSKGKIVHNMQKARELKRDKLRVERMPLLESLDRQISREMVGAVVSGDFSKIQELERQRQYLRDVTALPEIDKAKTVDDLSKISL